MNAFILQILGIFNLATPAILLYLTMPRVMLNPIAIALYSLGAGAYIAYLHYKQGLQAKEHLQYAPSRQSLDMFNAEMLKCGLDPKDVTLYYAYISDVITSAVFNTILINQIFWKNIINDSDFNSAKCLVETYTLPSLPENRRLLEDNINKALTPEAQMFHFRRELYNVLYNTSNKRILMLGIFGTLTMLTGFIVAFATMPIIGAFVSLFLGVLAATLADNALGYINNAIFKSGQVKNADLFAAHFSTKEEILAAADFFEEQEVFAQEYRNSVGGLIAILPTAMIFGCPSGATRARHLRNIANN